ncbi:KilA-N domain-containing protein [Caballeronia sp. LZ033]|uniref:KilA-N domain-containing protein n=1 Tax=Caballeronia sp. LZ033 TaxID=3038566 RepID=UPI0028678FAB|nr:KilA-N domain-containing protein [Caballeronia sp. LZ033]MDR5813351.1 KilA-N domain-containing protein [Caballeronia sp. LZ033]
MQALVVGKAVVKCDAAGLISLTDLFTAAQAQGFAIGKLDPRAWTRSPRAKTSGTTGKVSVSGGPGWDFISTVAGTLNVAATHILKATRGKGGGTFAHWQIALAYAKYLSPELHMQVNEVYARAKAGDVTLADEIADRASPAQQEWLAKRVQGKVARARFTSTLSEHGVTGRGFGDCTNAIYRGTLGGSKKEICQANGLDYKKGRSLRDVMNIDDLIATSMAELVAAKQIQKFNVRGNQPCADECLRSASKVAALMQ